MRYYTRLIETSKRESGWDAVDESKIYQTQVKTYFVPIRGNEKAIELLRKRLHEENLLDGNKAHFFDFKNEVISERDVDTLIKYAVSSTGHEMHKLFGQLEVPTNMPIAGSPFGVAKMITKQYKDALGKELNKGDLVFYVSTTWSASPHFGRIHDPETFTVKPFYKTRNWGWDSSRQAYGYTNNFVYKEDYARRLGNKFTQTVKIDINEIPDEEMRKFAASLR